MNSLSKQLNESLNESFKKTHSDLLSTLDKAVDLAKKSFVESKKEGAKTTGTEGKDVANKLQAIYAALSTGDPKDDSENDEIFK